MDKSEDFDILFGQGFKDHIELQGGTPITFEEHVNKLGKIARGGLFELYYLAEMLGQEIELIDLPENESKQKNTTKIKPFDLKQGLKSITISRMKKKDGTIHYGSDLKGWHNYTKTDFANSTIKSKCSGDCLYGALALALGIEIESVIKQFQDHLKNHEVAKKIFERRLNFDRNLLDDRAGAVIDREHQVKLKREKIEGKDRGQWTEKITASIKHENMDRGEATLKSVKKKMKDHMLPGDEFGHIIAKMFGGPGSEDNIIPMTFMLNRSRYRITEIKIENVLIEYEDWKAKVEVILYYNLENYERRVRPYKLDLLVKFYSGKNIQKKFSIDEHFDNDT